jgi:hypothetical protein
MGISVSVQNKTKDTMKYMNDVKGIAVLVGIPQERNARPEDGSITNAELLFIHTNGSPKMHIPARPVIEPAVEDDKVVISNLLGEAVKALLDGNKTLMREYLEKAGLEGQGASQDWFDNPKNNWPPNSPSVIKAKEKKGSTDPKPLIDTGELRKAITYIVIGSD